MWMWLVVGSGSMAGDAAATSFMPSLSYVSHSGPTYHSPNSCNFPPWSDEKALATFKYGPLASRKMIFRFVDYPILRLNLGFEISDICRRAIRRRSADAPCAVFALLCPNRQVRI